jgi:glyoxylase I family protein
MGIQRFLHTSLNVTDLARSTEFYEQILGLRPEADRNLNFPGLWYQVGDYQLHLIVQPEVAPILDQERWGRNRHVAFAIDDVAAFRQHLETLNYPFRASMSGRPAIFLQDPDGNVIELGQIEG